MKHDADRTDEPANECNALVSSAENLTSAGSTRSSSRTSLAIFIGLSASEKEKAGEEM